MAVSKRAVWLPRNNAIGLRNDFTTDKKAIKFHQRRWTQRKTLLCCALTALSLLMTLLTISNLYSLTHSTDPCIVAHQSVLELSKRTTTALGNNNKLPKIIHQQWKSSEIPPGKYSKFHKAWLELFPEPEYTHMLWTDEKARELIKEQYPWFLPVYDGYDFNIKRVDAARYFILHAYGGLYADMDYEPLTNFWNYLPTDRVGFVESPYRFNEYHQNSLMTSPKEHVFWTTAFEVLIEIKDKGVLKSTGPSFVDEALNRVDSSQYYTLPCENFHRIPFHQQKGEESPWITRLHQGTFGRLYPMKYCGDFAAADTCHFGRHHNAVSYMTDVGVWRMIF